MRSNSIPAIKRNIEREKEISLINIINFYLFMFLVRHQKKIILILMKIINIYIQVGQECCYNIFGINNNIIKIIEIKNKRKRNRIYEKKKIKNIHIYIGIEVGKGMSSFFILF